MDLFAPDPVENLLPGDGVVNYHGRLLAVEEADAFFTALMAKVPWKKDEIIMFGKRIMTAREIAWYGDEGLSYTYSGTTKLPLPWSRELLELKERVEKASGEIYNTCLLNLYHHGGEGMSWHSDDEGALVRHSAIGSVSLGAERKFSLKHKQTRETRSILLEHGSLLIMKGATQQHWLHSIPKTTRVKTPRINLTFRQMKW